MIDLNASDYEGLIPLFSEEFGSVRDIYVADTDVQTWEKLLVALRESSWDPDLRLGAQSVALVPAAMILADVPPGADTYTLRVTVGELWLWCHFYSADEIEFSLQAGQVESARDLERLVAFMVWVSAVLAKDVKLTLEAPGGGNAPPLLLVRKESGGLQVFPV